MPDDIAHLALARSLAVRQPLLSHRDLRLVDEVVTRLLERASEGPRAVWEAIDDLIEGVETALDEQNAERAEVREAVRVELLGPSSRDRSGAAVVAAGARIGMTMGDARELLEANDRVVVDDPDAGFAADQHRTRLDGTSATLALGEVEREAEDDPYDDWDLSDVHAGSGR